VSKYSGRLPISSKFKAHGLQMKRNAEIERDRQPPEV
jgi:hypothetical protein